MTQTTSIDYQGWVGRTAIDHSGEKIGRIEELYLDDATGQPEWLAIKTGLLGTKLSFAPMTGAVAAGDGLLRRGLFAAHRFVLKRPPVSRRTSPSSSSFRRCAATARSASACIFGCTSV